MRVKIVHFIIIRTSVLYKVALWVYLSFWVIIVGKMLEFVVTFCFFQFIAKYDFWVNILMELLRSMKCSKMCSFKKGQKKDFVFIDSQCLGREIEDSSVLNIGLLVPIFLFTFCLSFLVSFNGCKLGGSLCSGTGNVLL